ncbi:MAG: response regulator [Candidatus Anammoxibacter sp.]
MTNILVIDDEECIHDSFRLALTPENSVDIASSGEEGIAKVTNRQPDIIFLDLKMPGIGGIDTLNQLQTICPRIPTVILTAFFEENRVMLEKARANGCLFELCRKPMGREQIKLIVRDYENRLKPGNGTMMSKYSNKSEQDSATQNYERYFFKLYLAGNASEYGKIIECLKKLFDNHLNYYDLEVINLTRNPELAERDNIIATPSIVNGNCGEPLMVIGDMSNGASVLSGLGLINNADLCEAQVGCAC